MSRFLLKPPALILLGTNLVPVIGVVAWEWDAFVLLMLYWLETAVIAFWTIVGIATLPRAALEEFQITNTTSWKPQAASSPVGLAAFFTLHSGIFMGVHFPVP